jgi:hypothetical protein
MRIPLSIRSPSSFAIVTLRVVEMQGEFTGYLNESMLGTRCRYLEDFLCIESTTSTTGYYEYSLFWKGMLNVYKPALFE